MKLSSKIMLLPAMALLVFSCNRNLQKQQPPEEDFQTEYITTLKNDPVLPGVPSSVSFVDENHLVVASAKASQVILFDASGNQIRTIGNSGQGPFEYVSPSIVRASENKIFVWCNNLTKLIQYDLDGKPLAENSFPIAIKDFVVHGNYAGFYLAGGLSREGVIQIYDLEQEAFVQGFGHKDNEHHILSSLECAGGMDLMDGNLLFAPASQTLVYKLGLDDLALTSSIIEDEDFKVEKANESYNEIIPDPNKAFPYLFGNDVITGVYVTTDKVIVMAEVGKIEMDGLQSADYSKRRWKYYVLDHDLALRKVLLSLPVPGSSSCMFAAAADNLYFLRMTEDMEGYELHQVKIDG